MPKQQHRNRLRAISLCTAAILSGLLYQNDAAAQPPDSSFHTLVNIQVRGKYRYIVSNGLPNHEVGQFPNRNNPNRISPQRHAFRVAADPVLASQTTVMDGRPFGIAVNGIPFDPGTAEVWNRDHRFHYEALTGAVNLGLDNSNAHVQPTGAYHYHGLPVELIKKLQLGSNATMTLIGYAADGFPIYGPKSHADPQAPTSNTVILQSSYRLKRGQRQLGPNGPYDGSFASDFEYVDGLGDLDECNGRTGVTPEYPDGTYYYVLTTDFPFIPRLCRGTPDESFDRRGPPPGGRPAGGPPGRRPPPPRGY